MSELGKLIDIVSKQDDTIKNMLKIIDKLQAQLETHTSRINELKNRLR